MIGPKKRKFLTSWYVKNNWLEYSIAKDAVFCFPCYLFKNEGELGGDHFVGKGFSTWIKKKRLGVHVGGPNSPHYNCVKKCEDLMNQDQSIASALVKQSQQVKNDFVFRLKASLQVTRFLLSGGLSFRGHDESIESSCKGHFLETLQLLRTRDSELDKSITNAPQNNQMISPTIQKDLCYACALETIREIVCKLGDGLFAILVDESGDIAGKEQMSIVLRFIDDTGFVVEHFLGIVHVEETTALSLKTALECTLSQYGLCISNIRGQGYDGASNMHGRLGGLKTLIQNENPYAYNVHCLAHQLQLSLLASLKGLVEATNLASALSEGILTTGRGLNQQLTLVRPGDTRWGSHYRTLLNLQKLYPSVIEVLQHLQIHDKSGETKSLLRELHTFEFSFMLHVMVEVLGVTWDLSTALQRHEQDLLNALKLVEIAKSRLKSMRSDDGWNLIFQKVLVFCERCSLDVPDMNDLYVKVNTSARRAPIISNTHHYKIDCLFEIIDRFVEELDSRFDVASTELLSCLACLNPSSSFDAFDKKALLRMTEFYPSEFS